MLIHSTFKEINNVEKITYMLTSNKKLYLILIKFKVNINVDFSKVLYSIVKAHAYDFLLYLTDVFTLLQMYTRFVFLRYLCNGR